MWRRSLSPGSQASSIHALQEMRRACDRRWPQRIDSGGLLSSRELELARYGLKLLKRNPSFTPCLDGRYLLLGPDKELNHSEISKFSKRDADAYSRYESELERFCKLMDPILDSPRPEFMQGISSLQDRIKNKVQNSAFWTRLLHQAASLRQKDRVYVLKATLAIDAVSR
ncbi:hypothetical protein REPUB_Repub09cG0183900 [Reevesia pubescens]